MRPVFIIGSPRSGTSVLTWALGQHPNLYPLEETVWFGKFHTGSAQAFEIGSSRAELSQLSAMGIERREFMESLGRAVDEMIRRHQTWPVAPVSQDRAFARARSPGDPKGRWIDGTPENSFHVEGLDELFPDASFIHLVREPHLVARSLRQFHRIGGRQHTAGEAYRKWVAHVRACLVAEETLGQGRVLRVLHRDLAAEPERVVRACLDFLGEPYAPDCLLPLRERINSSGTDAPPEPEGAVEIEPELLAEARAVAAGLFAEAEDAA
jgi:hypothetical protein